VRSQCLSSPIAVPRAFLHLQVGDIRLADGGCFMCGDDGHTWDTCPNGNDEDEVSDGSLEEHPFDEVLDLISSKTMEHVVLLTAVRRLELPHPRRMPCHYCPRLPADWLPQFSIPHRAPFFKFDSHCLLALGDSVTPLRFCAKSHCYLPILRSNRQIKMSNPRQTN
jgi:hypothetical protein